MMPQMGYPTMPALPISQYGSMGAGSFPSTSGVFPSNLGSYGADLGSNFGPRPMSGLPTGQDTATFSPAPQSSTVRPPRPRPMTSSSEASEGVNENWPENLNKTEAATLTPGAQTVKRLEQPLIDFLNKNPDFREKIDNISWETITDNVTSTTSKTRVSLHNSFKRIPDWVVDRMIKQLDPNQQDAARQLVAWIRKPPSKEELAAIQNAEKSNTKQQAPSQRKRAADENTDPFSAINWDSVPSSKKQKQSY
jgi:hypothetical protein